MSPELAHPEIKIPEYVNPFAELDKLHPKSKDGEYKEQVGEFELAAAYLMETPEVIEGNEGWILTNPSHVFEYDGKLIAYFRAEPKTKHLGETKSVPYEITFDEHGKPSIERYEDLPSVDGEDPRVIKNMPYRDENGEIQIGWCVTAVVATPTSKTIAQENKRRKKPLPITDKDKETVDYIEQVFYCGPDLKNLKEVNRLRDYKNTVPSPVEDPERPGKMLLDLFLRPKPHIAYGGRVEAINDVTAEHFTHAMNITEEYLPNENADINQKHRELANIELRYDDEDKIVSPAEHRSHLGKAGLDNAWQLKSYTDQGKKGKINPPVAEIYTGVNTVHRVPGHPNWLLLDIHDATAPKNSEGKNILHYRLSRALYILPSEENPKGRFISLGPVAVRKDFPKSPAKPAEGDVGDFEDILYGSLGDLDIDHPIHGRVRIMATGMSDTTVGIALFKQKNKPAEEVLTA